MTSRAYWLAAALVALFLALPGSGAQAGGFVFTRTVRIDLTSSAHPRGALAPVHAHSFHVDGTFWSNTDAATTATASAVCRGCAGEAVSVQVLYLQRSPRMKLDNVAVAWTQGCDSCTASALSLQVVVVSGPGTLVPSNRALALDAACAQCHATAAAYQLVVAASGRGSLARLSPTALRAVDDWAKTQARLLHDAPAGTVAQRALERGPAVSALANIVNRELGTRTTAARLRITGR
jgi:hypothetical protein